MSNIKISGVKVGIILAIAVIFLSFVSAESFSSTSVSNARYYSTTSTYTAPSGFAYSNLISGINAPENEEEFYDLMVTILPGGCKPMVVRSDLLEEQNVPVFCEITAVKINPGVDISKIARISVKNLENNPYIAGVGFYPARAAIRSTTNLVNSPVTNNIGYAVVVLKRTETENAMPDNITTNLSAMFEYDATNGFGIGVNELYLPVMSDDEFTSRQKEYGFFNGAGYLRVDSMDQNTAVVSIYDSQNRRLFSQRLEKDKTSKEFRIPTSIFLSQHESQTVTMTLREITMPQTSAKIMVNDGSYVAYKNGKFADKCTLTNVVSSGGGTGTVTVNCGGKTVTLEKKFNKIKLNVDGTSGDYALGDKISVLNDNVIKSYYLAYAGNIPNDNIVNNQKTFIFLINESKSLISADKIKTIGNDIERQINNLKKGDYYASLNKIKTSSGYNLVLLFEGESVGGITFEQAKFENAALNSASGGTENYYNKAKTGYDDVESKFPNEVNNYGALGATNETFGPLSLWSKYALAKALNQEQDALDILSEIRNTYPNSKNVIKNSKGIDKTAEQLMAESDNLLSSEGASTFIEDQNLYLELVSVNEPSDSEASVELTYSGIVSSETTTEPAVGTPISKTGEATLKIGEKFSTAIEKFSLIVKNITIDKKVNMTYSCTGKGINNQELLLSSGNVQVINVCDVQVTVGEINYNIDEKKSNVSLKIEGRKTIKVNEKINELNFKLVGIVKDASNVITSAKVDYVCPSKTGSSVEFKKGDMVADCFIKILDIKEDEITIAYQLASTTSTPKKTSTETEAGIEQKTARQGEKFIENDKVHVTLKSFTADKAIFTYSCNNSASKDIDIKKGNTEILEGCDNAQIRVDKINLKEVAKVELNPKIKGRIREANFTFSIGIEKRSDFLLPAPDEMNKQIKELDETIGKWKNATEKLGKVVKGMKAACLVTSGALTLKNWATGLTGEATARHEVMTRQGGWNDICKEEIAAKHYSTENECLQDKNSEIENSVEETTKLMQDYQEAEEARVEAAKNDKGVTDYNKVKEDQLSTLKSSYSGSIKVLGQDGKEKEVDIGEILKNMNLSDGDASSVDLRELDLNLKLMKSNVDESLKKSASKKVENLLSQFNERSKDREGARKAAEIFDLPAGLIGEPIVSKNTVQRPYSIKKWGDYEQALNDKGLTLPAGEIVSSTSMVEVIPYGANSYLYVLAGTKDNLHTERIFKLSQDTSGAKSLIKVFDAKKGTDDLKGQEYSQLKNIRFKLYDASTYKNPCKNCNYVEVFNSEPYKGYPSLLPFNETGGWYVSIRQNIASFGNLKSYQDSGALSSFYLCNVGKNGMMEDQVGDDICQNFNINTADANVEFSGLTASETKKKLNDANNAIKSAQDQLAKNPSAEYITINKIRLKVKGVQGTAGGKCTDFMSPQDCNILFNVCDPVVCPSSRCDMGGNYRVDNVIQSGILGSIALCLPNFKEGIVIPVCLSGIHAGMEGWISIMQAHRDCLNESIATNKTVGICDEIYSVYQCDFMWKQIGPYANALAKNALSGTLFGAGTKGGGEYMFVNQAFSNAENSWQYFTSSYASDSKLSFGARSFSEIGSEVCKAKLSATYPDVLGTALEPDSPVQIYAFFDEMTYTDATVPPTSQYKVYYHIFAGNDQGHYYQVYLKSSASSFGVTSRGYSNIDSGYITKGETVDQTKDFLDNSGFKELCVRIDTKDYCGFKSVTTDFAINYAKDKSLEDQATNSVTTEKECISGSPSLGALITPNIQQGVEQVISPELYNQGIVRVCASQNPGATVNPSRWSEVGYCDNTNIKCWVDVNSVKNAIQGQGIENSTLQQIDDMNIQQMIDEGMMTNAAGNDSLEIIRKNYPLLEDTFTPSDYVNMEKDISAAYDKMIFSSQKAALLYYKSMVYDRIARVLGKTNVAGDNPANVESSATSTLTGVSLSNGESYNFVVNGVSHKMTIASIQSSTVGIIVASTTPQQAILTLTYDDKATVSFDLDGDSVNDVKIELLRITQDNQGILSADFDIIILGAAVTGGSETIKSSDTNQQSVYTIKSVSKFLLSYDFVFKNGEQTNFYFGTDSRTNLRYSKRGFDITLFNVENNEFIKMDNFDTYLNELKSDSSEDYVIASELVGATINSNNIILATVTSSTHDEETNLLAKMIWSEQRDQGEEAMAAAGWIAINRVDSNNFQDTVQEVLEESNQFSLNNEFDKTNLASTDSEAKTNAIEIAKNIINNKESIPSRYENYFYFGNDISSDSTYVSEKMKNCKASDMGFVYERIDSTNMYVSNKDYTNC